MERHWIRNACRCGAWRAGATAAVALATLLALVGRPAQARPAPRFTAAALPAGLEIDAPLATEPSTAASRLITTSAIETTWFGGTVWAADSNRYEAIPGGTWTFDSGVGSSMVPPGDACKSAGYHRTFEGWTEGPSGTQAEPNTWRRTTTCVIGVGSSMWLGKTAAEAGALCYATGAGYGHSWDYYLGKTFQYPGSGSVTLSFDYAVEAEPSFDYLYVEVDTTGTASAPSALVRISSYTGNTSGHGTWILQPGITLPAHPGPVRILFRGMSDSAYDDEDGSYPTTCGLAAVDNVTLIGALSDVSTFETSDNGWAPVAFCGAGKWADLADVATLNPLPDCAINLGNCAMADTVLLFHQPGYNNFRDNLDDLVLSPWIDLRRAGIASMAGCFLEFDGYFNLKASAHAYAGFKIEWSPGPCAAGGGSVSPLYGPAFAYYGGFEPRCLANGQPERIDLSPYVPANAWAVRVGLLFSAYCGLCDPDPDAAAWFDNVRFGVLDRSAPPLTAPFSLNAERAFDAFATDGTLDPAATARVDSWGDTLSCRAEGTNVEVRVNFRVRPGPFTNSAALNSWAAGHWTAAPGIGPGWWTARMDTAELNSGPVASIWMTALHESDPHFGGGTDRDRGADGDTGLSHDLFPDHLLTPGARLDYFYSARYLPPDPRNPAGDAWRVLPDTTGGHYDEMEVLPSSLSADTTWNCVLYLNGHAGDADAYRRLEEAGLHQVLGAGGLNAEGERFDRADLFSPAGVAVRLQASSTQLGAYGTILWSMGRYADAYKSTPIDDAYATRLTDWLTAATPARPRRLWYSGSQAVYQLTHGTTAQRALARNYLGADASLSDNITATCAGLGAVPGAHFNAPGAVASRASSCTSRNADRLVIHPSAAATARGQSKLSATGNLISISNDVPAAGRRTLVDAFPLYTLRDAGGSCDDPSAVTQRVVSALGWFGLPDGGACTPGGVSDVPPVPGPSARGVLSLDPLFRQAGEEGWRIRFSLPVAQPATLRVHDVTGRLIVTLAEEAPLVAGRHELAWDGRGAAGQRVSAGLYFVRLSTSSGSRSMKVVVTTR